MDRNDLNRSNMRPQNSREVPTASKMPSEMMLPSGGDQLHDSVRSSKPVLNGAVEPSDLCSVTALLRNERLLGQQCLATESQLGRLHLTIARCSRILRLGPHIQRTLVECTRLGDKANFVVLLRALQEALDATASLSSAAFHDASLARLHRATHVDGYPVSFVDNLSLDTKQSVLDFVHKVRCDAEFIHGRLANLSHRELLAILPGQGRAKSSESVFGPSGRPVPQILENLKSVVDRQTAWLASGLEFGSPLETLILATHRPGPLRIMDDVVATRVWATVCARLIVEQHPGSEKLVPAVVDVWALNSPWTGKGRLELWILQTLRDGAFLLNKPRKPTFQMHVQGRLETHREDEMRRETFYNNAVNSLLDLLSDRDWPSVLPDGAIMMCARIHDLLSISTGHQSAFPSFIGTRWLVTSFLPDVLTFPEIYDMAQHHLISEQARQRILRETAMRAQKVMLDAIYSWKLGGERLPSETILRVANVLQRFQSISQSAQDRSNPVATPKVLPRQSVDTTFLALSNSDFMTIVSVLYPVRRADSLASDRHSKSVTLRSSASSESGFSLFKSAASWEHLNVSTPPPTPLLPVVGITHGVESLSIGAKELHAEPSKPEQTASTTNFDLDERNLRVACAHARNSPAQSQWIMLVDEERKSLCSVRQKLATLLSPIGQNNCDVRSRLPDFVACQSSLRRLLQEYEAGHEEPHSSWSAIFNEICNALEDRQLRAQRELDFVAAHEWYLHLRTLHHLMAQDDHDKTLAALLDTIAYEAQQSLNQTLTIIEQCDSWRLHLRENFNKTLAALTGYEQSSRILRNKMWYIYDVRTSSAYDETRSIHSALCLMGNAEQGSRKVLPVRQRNSSRNAPSAFHLKTEEQVAELLSASPHHGGPNKLSDDQTRALAVWMQKHHIENLCKGEERLHKLCMEVRKCVDLLVQDPLPDSAALWSNPLFAQDARTRRDGNPKSLPIQFDPLHSAGRYQELQNQRRDGSEDAWSISSKAMSNKSSGERIEGRSPTWTTKSSALFWSPAVTEEGQSSTATSIALSHTEQISSPQRRVIEPEAFCTTFVESLRQHLTSLLLSDLAGIFFSEGSETDRAFWSGLGGDLTQTYLLSVLRPSPIPDVSHGLSSQRFEFTNAFRVLFQQFAVLTGPVAKLNILHDIDRLVDKQIRHDSDLTDSSHTLQVDKKVDCFRQLFSDPIIRPPFIFQDLQLIASMIPASTLESTAQGKTFWNAAIAISGLRQEARNIMVETADGIIAYHSNNRGHGRSSPPSSTAQRRRDTAAFPSSASATRSQTDSSNYSMADAATLLQIAAKDNDPVAQRELATLYLTHPELLPLIIAPFTRPSEVFNPELEGKWRKNMDPNRCDPRIMCVALHWMTLSCRGGDALAKEYLRQTEEIERIP